jgi:hypothetical protein
MRIATMPIALTCRPTPLAHELARSTVRVLSEIEREEPLDALHGRRGDVDLPGLRKWRSMYSRRAESCMAVDWSDVETRA